ncbi:MAG: phage terminase large subunit [Actinoallomurus sp.]
MIAAAPPTSDCARVTLSRTQQAFVDDPHPFTLFVGGVGAGKTYAGAARALRHRFGSTRPSLGLVVSPSYPMLRDATWRTALEVWAPVIERVIGNEMRLVLGTGDEVIFRSADDPERLRGPNAAWAWIDEAALCHPDTWPITIGRLRQHGELGEAWLTTTPKGMNWVYETFVVQATDQTAVHRAATASNPFVAEGFVSSLRSQYSGDFARQELEAEFIADLAGALIEWRWLDAARSRPAAYDPAGGPVTAGLDVAGPGEAETVLCLRQGGRMLELLAWPDPDPRGAVLAALRPWQHRGLDRVVVDSAGIGYYLARHLEDQGIRVRDVNVGERPTTDDGAERYANLKAELYWALRLRLADGDLAGLTDGALIAQLAGLRYDHDGRGRVRVESKVDARRRGLKSPDRAEALMLAFSPADPRAARAALYGLRSG